MTQNLNNAPHRSTDLSDLNTNSLEFKTVYLQSHITSLIQPMDHEEISTFKVHYLRTTLKGLMKLFKCPIMSCCETNGSHTKSCMNGT